jgi:DNA-binding transcriptional LysR family regulator
LGELPAEGIGAGPMRLAPGADAGNAEVEMSPMPKLRDLNKLSAFVRVAERLSFTKAAADLRTTPSVVSKHVSDLENALGFSLLNRSTHGVVLTEAGEGLFKNCLQMFADLDEYVVEMRNLQTGPYGSLHVQASASYAHWVLAPLMSEFIRRYPHLRVKLSAETGTLNAVEDGCDVIVASKKPSVPGLIDREIGGIPHVICASPDYFQRSGRPGGPQDLREHNCLVNSFLAPKEWLFRDGSQQITVEVRGTFSSNSSAVLVQVALDGVGIVRVPHYAAKAALGSGALEAIFEDEAQSPERLRAYFSKTKHLPAKIIDFVEFLRGAVRAR